VGSTWHSLLVLLPLIDEAGGRAPRPGQVGPPASRIGAGRRGRAPPLAGRRGRAAPPGRLLGLATRQGRTARAGPTRAFVYDAVVRKKK
jgi:hypothetical protein